MRGNSRRSRSSPESNLVCPTILVTRWCTMCVITVRALIWRMSTNYLALSSVCTQAPNFPASASGLLSFNELLIDTVDVCGQKALWTREQLFTSRYKGRVAVLTFHHKVR